MENVVDWDEESIVVIPGLPDNLSAPDDDRPSYPSSTLSFVKILRAAGYPVRVATPDDVREISHHAADVWLPLVDFGLQVLAGGAGNVLADVIMRTLGSIPGRRSMAHIRWKVQSPDGSVREFRYDGNAEAAVEVARSFERSLGFGSDDR